MTFTLCIILCSPNIFADVLSQEKLKTHVRWKLKVKKEQVQIRKSGTKVLFSSLDPEFFEEFAANVVQIDKDKSYHKDFKFKRAENPGDVFEMEIDLKDDSIELFSFYKPDQGQYILDFWINQDVIATKKSAIASQPKVLKVAKNTPAKKVKKKVVKKKPVKVEKALTKANMAGFNIIDPDQIKQKRSKEKYRDFRYGAAFVWDYQPLIPVLEQDVDLTVKAPDFFYTLKDREFLADKIESHMQLTINLYRKQKWGLMTRSINLFEERYGREKYRDLNDFMRAVSMIKNAINQKIKPTFSTKVNAEGETVPMEEYSKKGIMASARSMMANIVDRTQDYELAQAVLRYLIQYSRNENDHVNGLNYAKNLYIKASDAADDDMLVYSSRVILKSLTELKQMEKVEEFLKNKAVMRILPKQEGLAYKSYINLFNDDTKQVIADFTANQAGMTKPIHPAVLYNTAEAYFRQAQYEKAVKLFDEFTAQYSYMTESGNARLRMALSYDLNGKAHDQVLKLYQESINKTSALNIRFEAKLRYVGMRLCRKLQLTDEDKEVQAFITPDKAEKKAMTAEHKKLLWLVRMRSMIVQEQYEEALTYLVSLPLDTVRMIEKRTFEADGAEIILGMIQNAYLASDYAKAVKVWELYKNKYENKVARNPYMNFIVADSFLKLGLFKSYERSLDYLKDIKEDKARAFPLWVAPHKKITVANYLVELELNNLLKQRDFKGLNKHLEAHKGNKNINYNFYNGLVSNKLKAYNNSVASFEKLLVTPNINNVLTPEQNLMMIEAYLESLFEVGPGKRFRKNASALINDLRRQKTKKITPYITRAEYLYIESLFAESTVNYSLLATKAGEFLADHKESSYTHRVNYLNGLAQIKSNQVEQGKKILNELIGKEGVPEYIKGLARTELSSLVLENNTL